MWQFWVVVLSSFFIYFKETLVAFLTLPLTVCVTSMKVTLLSIIDGKRYRKLNYYKIHV